MSFHKTSHVFSKSQVLIPFSSIASCLRACSKSTLLRLRRTLIAATCRMPKCTSWMAAISRSIPERIRLCNSTGVLSVLWVPGTARS
jgi:hypothetical protein